MAWYNQLKPGLGGDRDKAWWGKEFVGSGAALYHN